MRRVAERPARFQQAPAAPQPSASRDVRTRWLRRSPRRADRARPRGRRPDRRRRSPHRGWTRRMPRAPCPSRAAAHPQGRGPQDALNPLELDDGRTVIALELHRGGPLGRERRERPRRHRNVTGDGGSQAGVGAPIEGGAVDARQPSCAGAAERVELPGAIDQSADLDARALEGRVASRGPKRLTGGDADASQRGPRARASTARRRATRATRSPRGKAWRARARPRSRSPALGAGCDSSSMPPESVEASSEAVWRRWCARIVEPRDEAGRPAARRRTRARTARSAQGRTRGGPGPRRPRAGLRRRSRRGSPRRTTSRPPMRSPGRRPRRPRPGPSPAP